MTAEAGANGAHQPDERLEFIERAVQGDPSVLPALRAWLDVHPECWNDVTAEERQVRQKLVEHMERAPNPVVGKALQEISERRCTALTRELAGPAPSALERLLVDRIVTCWLYVQTVEQQYLRQWDGLSIGQADFHERRLTRAQNRLLAAIRTFAQVRRLGFPAVQVNIGDQQINVAAQ